MSTAKTRTTKRIGFLATLAASGLLLLAGAAPASAAQQWRIESLSNTTAQPGDFLDYRVQIANSGDEAMNGEPIILKGTLPKGFTVADPAGPVGTDPSNPHFFLLGGDIPANFTLFDLTEFNLQPCTAIDGSPLVGGESQVKCESTSPTPAHVSEGVQVLYLPVAVDNEEATPGEILTAHFEVEGGGVPSAASTVDPTLISATPADFGIDAFDMQIRDGAGNPFTQAAGHPADIVTNIDFNTLTKPLPLAGHVWPVESPKDVFVDLPPGFVGNPTAVGECTALQLANSEGLGAKPLCPSASQVGTTVTRFNGDGSPPLTVGPFPVYNIAPPPGVPARFGFNVMGTVLTLDVALRSDGDYGLSVNSRGIPQPLPVSGTTVTFWGRPASSAHDPERACPGESSPFEGGLTCDGGEEVALLRNPTSCTPGEGLDFSARVDSWVDPGDFKSATISSHKLPGWPSTPEDWGVEQEMTGCEEVPVKGKLSAQPTALDTESPTGLNVTVEVPNPGLENPEGIASSDIKAVEVALPQGVTINPSQAEGLDVCRPSQYASEELSFHPTPNTGCPSASKIGTVVVHTPLLEETIEGNVYVAQQDDPRTAAKGAENPFDSLLALYIVMKNPERGILIKLAGKVAPDPKTGRIVTTFDDVPQLPFSRFDFKFREGARAPLITPPTCGEYTTEAVFTPWSDPENQITSTSSFEILRGIGGGACPPAGVPPFKPGFSAGSLNNNAGSHSPFLMRLTRNDGDQDMTKFSSVLPPGVTAKIAGVEKCSEAAIAIAKSKTGLEERESPSCSASSQIGRSLAGAGVGSVLTYVPGKLYLAGPFGGAPLSVVAITPAVAGPFDVGVVVVREALTLDRRTAEVHVDGDKSDPIPHILAGIPLKLRDLRVYVDRPEFVLNPTSCDPSQVGATLFGGFLDVFSSADDKPVSLASRFQAASCATLGFKPRLSLALEGGAKRGGHPALRAVLRPRPGEANLSRAVVRLPRSAFLDQGHIRTICTRVQFAADSCPRGAVYGHVRATTSLLDTPLEGPVYLRSSDNQLPDLVFDLHGVVDIEAVGRIDSIGGRIRAIFDGVPDAPITKVVLDMQGGRRGLIENSQDLCAGTRRATARFSGHNGKRRNFRPIVRPDCGQGRKGKRSRASAVG